MRGGSTVLGVSENTCSVSLTTVKLTERTKYNGHRVVSIQFPGNGLCIDELGNTSAVAVRVGTHACNSGYYQQFEVFNGSVSGTVVLKSLGAALGKGKNFCIQADKRAGTDMKWNDCGTTNTYQQFKFA